MKNVIASRPPRCWPVLACARAPPAAVRRHALRRGRCQRRVRQPRGHGADRRQRLQFRPANKVVRLRTRAACRARAGASAASRYGAGTQGELRAGERLQSRHRHPPAERPAVRAAGLRRPAERDARPASLGRQYTSLFDSMANFVPAYFATQYEPVVMLTGANFREDNTIKYSGTFGALTAVAHWSFGTGLALPQVVAGGAAIGGNGENQGSSAATAPTAPRSPMAPAPCPRRSATTSSTRASAAAAAASARPPRRSATARPCAPDRRLPLGTEPGRDGRGDQGATTTTGWAASTRSRPSA